MIFGTATIDAKSRSLETSNDSYPLMANTVFSVTRPFFATGVIIALALGGFALSFHDLIKPHEYSILGASAFFAVMLGRYLAQLVLINRELRNSDQSVAIWGTYAHLNRLRKKAALIARGSYEGDAS